MEEMAVIDKVSYGRLLARATPRVIETDAENERAIAELERLDSLPRMTAEQRSLADLLTVLIEVFGSSSVTSDVVNGKRDISKQHARKLAEFFHVPVSVFI